MSAGHQGRRHMGSASSFICRACGAHFMSRSGGGFMFDLLHCDTCGNDRSVSHQELGEIHRIQQEYPGEPLTRDEYHTAAQATLEGCDCGGRFTYGASGRCPECRSTEDQWDEDPNGPHMFID
jgi:hypothetical protein